MSDKTNDDGTVLFETCKCRQAIIDPEKRAVRDYHFNSTNDKLVHKHIQE